MDSEVIATRVAQVWLGEDGILRVVMRPGVVISADDAVNVTAAGTKLIEGVKRPILTDISDVSSIDRSARTYFSGPEAARNCVASGVVVGSAVSRVIGNFFLGINKPPFPVRLFSSRSEALEWLRALVE